MSHLGIICPPIPGHVNPLCILGRSLVRRGHRVTVFQISDLSSKVRAEGLEFAALGADHFPPGALAESVARMKNLKGTDAIRLL